MAQTRLHFTAPRAEAERAYALLDQEFEEDGLPLAIAEVDEKNGIFEVSVYVENDADEAGRRIAARLGGELAAIEWRREILPDVDWVTRSLEGLQPVRVGRILVHGAHDRGRRHVGDLAIEIDAGLAFGTGHHGTTAGCLEMIAAVMRRERPRNALDLGTGSGVLAIAIAKLGVMDVLATDIDPVAARVARENVAKNRAAPRVHVVAATGFRHEAVRRGRPFDLIVANILARPLMELAPAMRRHAAAGGSVILSGILDAQRDRVLAAYVGQGFRHVRTLHREGWSTIWLGA
jgi:ribosomal protein L11 methyltransferase